MKRANNDLLRRVSFSKDNDNPAEFSKGDQFVDPLSPLDNNPGVIDKSVFVRPDPLAALMGRSKEPKDEVSLLVAQKKKAGIGLRRMPI
jgi:hypothetical protein